MHLWVFLVANPFMLRLKRTKDMRRPRTWELLQLDAGDYSEGNTNTTHLTLGVPTHKSSSVGEFGGQITSSSIQGVSQFTEGSALAFLKKRERKREIEKKGEKSIEKKKNKRKNGEVSEEGSKSEPTGPTRVKSCHVRMPSSSGLTHQQKKHSAVQVHPSLPSRALAKHRHNPHPLQALCSLNLAAPAYRKQEEYSSFFPSLCCSTMFGICSHA